MQGVSVSAVSTTLCLKESNRLLRNNETASVWAGRQRLVRLSGERLGLEAQNKTVFVNLIVCCWWSVFLPVRWQTATRPNRAKIPRLSALWIHMALCWAGFQVFYLKKRPRLLSISVRWIPVLQSSLQVMDKHWRLCLQTSCICVDLRCDQWSTDMDVLTADAGILESTVADKKQYIITLFDFWWNYMYIYFT